MELEFKGADLCLKEFLKMLPRTDVKYFISSMLNLKNSMDFTRMQLKYMIGW